MYLLSVIFYSICQKILNIHLCHELHNQCCDPPLGHEANDCVLVTETNLVHVTVILHGVLKCSASWELGFFFSFVYLFIFIPCFVYFLTDFTSVFISPNAVSFYAVIQFISHIVPVCAARHCMKYKRKILQID